MNTSIPAELGSLSPADYSVRSEASIGLLRATSPGASVTVLADLLRRDGDLVQAELLRHGALMIRGFGVRTIEDFERAWGGAFQLRQDYRYTLKEAGRKRLSRFVVNSNYSRAHGAVGVYRFHHENMHLPRSESPDWLAFCCLQAPRTGGETGVLNTASAFDQLSRPLQDKLLESRQRFKLLIPRQLWEEEFHALDPRGVATACEALGYDAVRVTDASVQFCFERSCAEQHRLNGRRSVLLDRSAYGVTGDFLRAFRAYHATLRAPMHHGLQRTWESSGAAVIVAARRFIKTRIERVWLALDRDERAELSWACARQAAAVPYQVGDILLVDNILVEHTAMPWTGDRRIVVAMGAYRAPLLDALS